MSSIDDLATWDAALSTDRLLRQETLQRAWTSAMLDDGTPTGYGYGWMLADYAGYRTLEHPGGINGFLCYALRIPEPRLFVAVLTNRMAPEPSPTLVALKVAGMACGRPYQEPETIRLDDAALDIVVGVYNFSKGAWALTREEGRLILRLGHFRTTLLPISPTEFLLESDPCIRAHFLLGAGGTATAVDVQGRYALRRERGVKAAQG